MTAEQSTSQPASQVIRQKHPTTLAGERRQRESELIELDTGNRKELGQGTL